MADVRDVPSSLALSNTTFSSDTLLITGALNTVNEDLYSAGVHFDILPLFCDPENHLSTADFEVGENSMLLDVFVNGELPGVYPDVGCEDVVLPSAPAPFPAARACARTPDM